MTLPSDIPEDVMKAARAALRDVSSAQRKRSGAATVIARAIMAEREAILNAANVYLIMQYGIGALGNPIDRGRIAAIRNGDAS